MKIKIPTPLDKTEENLSNFLINELCPLANSQFKSQYLEKTKEFLLSGLLNPEIQELIMPNNFEHFSTLYTIRSFYVQNFGYSLLNEKFINDLSTYLQDKKVLDVCAGTAFLAHQLKKQNVDIVAVDKYLPEQNGYGFQKTYMPIFQDDSVDYLKTLGGNFNSIIMSWPDYDTSFAREILEQMKPGQELIYIGEGYGGCTADDSFWDLLEQIAVVDSHATDLLRTNHHSFPSIHDKPTVFIIKD